MSQSTQCLGPVVPLVMFSWTKWWCLLFIHTNTKTAKHKHQSARRLQWISFLFSKVGIDCHTDRCHQDLSLLWQTDGVQQHVSIGFYKNGLNSSYFWNFEDSWQKHLDVFFARIVAAIFSIQMTAPMGKIKIAELRDGMPDRKLPKYRHCLN